MSSRNISVGTKEFWFIRKDGWIKQVAVDVDGHGVPVHPSWVLHESDPFMFGFDIKQDDCLSQTQLRYRKLTFLLRKLSGNLPILGKVFFEEV